MGANRKRFWMRAKRNKWRERKRVTLFAFAWTCTPFLLVKTPSVLAKSHQKKAQFCRFGKGKIQETKKLKSRGKVYKTFTRIICKCGHCFQTMATHVTYACKSLIKLAPARGMIANTRFTQDPCSNFPLGRGGGGVGLVLLGILGGGVPPGSPNPDPVPDKKMSFFTLVFRPGL